MADVRDHRPELTLLTIREVAKILRVCGRTLHRMIHDGKFPIAFKVGGQWRIKESELQKWMEYRKS